MTDTKFKEYSAAFSYKTRDDIESRIVSEKYVRLIMDVYMTPQEFAELITRFSGKEFKLKIEDFMSLSHDE